MNLKNRLRSRRQLSVVVSTYRLGSARGHFVQSDRNGYQQLPLVVTPEEVLSPVLVVVSSWQSSPTWVPTGAATAVNVCALLPAESVESIDVTE